MGVYSKLFCASIVLTVIAVIVLIFALFIFQILIKSEAKSGAVLAADSTDLWADIPGKSKVDIYRNQYFYNLENFDDVFSNRGSAEVQEMGPYVHYERQKLINLNFTNDSNVVNFNFFKFFTEAKNPVNNFNDTFTTLNLVSY